MRLRTSDKKSSSLPEFFRPLLWSYDFSRIDTERNKKLIMISAINYGDLTHWRWIIWFYGKKNVAEVLSAIPAEEMRERVRRLAALVFDVKNFNYALRGAR